MTIYIASQFGDIIALPKNNLKCTLVELHDTERWTTRNIVVR